MARHEVLRGITLARLVWWLSHLEGAVEIDGTRYNRYRVWYPRAPISLQYAKRNPAGAIGAAA